MRGKQAKKRTLPADEIYGSTVITKFINYVMVDGKKTIARKNVYAALESLKSKTKTEGIEAFEKAISNVKPKVEVRSRRVGGSNYQVPVPVGPDRQEALAFRWIIEAARNNRGAKPFAESLANELLNAFNNEGNAIRKKEDVKKMAEANRAFAQFA